MFRLDLGDRTAIAKVARAGSAAVERAALRLLGGAVAPALLAEGEGWTVTEDLGEGGVLAPAAWREAAGEAIGEVHRRTTGLAWEQPAVEVDHAAFRWRRALDALPGGLHAAGAPLGASATRDLRRVVRLLERPGARRALVHGDLCPENTVVVRGAVRIVDWEAAGPRHVALDAWPSTACWLRHAPGDPSVSADADFLRGWARSNPDAVPDAASRGAAAVAWASVAAHNLRARLLADALAGPLSHRARILGALHGAAERSAAAFPALAGALDRAHGALAVRWSVDAG